MVALRGLLIALVVAGTTAPACAEEAAPPTLDQALHESLNLFPLFTYERHVSPAGNELLEEWDVLWPFFGVWEDAHREEWGFAAPWPFVAATFGEEHNHFRIAPLFAWWRWNDERAVALFPLGGGFWDDHGWTMVLGPFYSQNDERTSRNVLFPLLWIFSEPKGGCASLWPVWHAAWRTTRDADGTDVHLDILPLTLLPLAGWSADTHHDDLHWSVAWPLGPTYSANHDAGSWSFRLLWEGFYIASDHPDHLEWRLLGGLVGCQSYYRDGMIEQEFWTVLWFFQFTIVHRAEAPRRSRHE